jgi:hypothetical protein
MNDKENLLRAVRFETPERIPMTFHINDACWNHYDQEALKDLMEEHSLLFPDYERPAGTVVPQYGLCARKDEPYTDPWGCVWETTDDGITGAVRGHPLADWADFDDYHAPSPNETNGTTPVDWAETRRNVQRARDNGDLVRGGLPHGHTYLRLQDIRGYENLTFDMADDDPRLPELIRMVSDFNYDYVMKWMELEPDLMSYPEDLGMQVGPMLSPDAFRKYIKPVYERLMQPARVAGCIVHMHSDGDIRSLVDDLIDGGVEVINLQDLVNGIDWIADRFPGRVCVDLDIDRQKITRFGSPEQIDDLIRREVETIGTPQGGLTMIYGLYPGVPLENARALMDAMERYAGYYS